jgi:hypothetical protein
MTTLLRIIAYLGLILTIAPSLLFFMDAMNLDTMKKAMTIGMVLWLCAAPLVQKSKEKTAGAPTRTADHPASTL